MPRLTKSDIETALLGGAAVPWTDAGGKSSTLHLSTASQRRLFRYLLDSRVRDVKLLPQDFIDGLAAAYVAPNDPAAPSVQQTVNPSASGPWKVHSLKIEGFGGVNVWNGKPLDFTIDGKSLLMEGPNGSGKSSLNAAIIWALTGERPRDQGAGSLEKLKPVFDATGMRVGDWPPVAAYPPNASSLGTPPNVSVEIVFSNAAGMRASALRRFDGKTISYVADPALQVPNILIEAGLLMPARMPHLRLDEGRGRLTDAVQKLTGLDELVELGSFVQALCHGSRDYLAYKNAELTTSQGEFSRQIERARNALAPASVAVPNFKPLDTDDKEGAMATFGKMLNDKAAQLINTVSGDLGQNLVLTDPKVQQRIVIELDNAEKDLNQGLQSLPTWQVVKTIAAALPTEARATARRATEVAEKALERANGYFQRQKADAKARLKAAGAHWHNVNLDGPIENCPLCEASLKSNPTLRLELDALRTAGEAAARSLEDNVRAIMAELASVIPQDIRRLLEEAVTSQPRADIEHEFRQKFAKADRYAKYLVKFKGLAELALANAPDVELTNAEVHTATSPVTSSVSTRLDAIERMCRLAEWYDAQSPQWIDWWATLTRSEHSDDKSLSAHLQHLSVSLGEAEPYRVGADAMRLAWTSGKIAGAIEKERLEREQITEALAPLKQLGNLAEAQARNAIAGLSERISAIHSATYIADRLKFQKAGLDKKDGLIVRGQLAADMSIDASLIANTSWLRGILWAFIFALREEAVDQIGSDVFPIMMLDDPQQTFDSEHRARWAEHIAKLQKTAPGVQVVLTTHDDQFLSLLNVLGVTGRRAHVSAPAEDFGHIAILEGDVLDRKWADTQKAKTPAAAEEYIAAVRKYAEGMLRLMLRGLDPSIPTAVLGECREKVSERHNAQIEPWRDQAFSTLVAALAKGCKEIKWMEQSHHAGVVLTMNEAIDVERHWRKTLRPALERGFRIVRDHRALHGGLTALHAFPPSVALPEGHKAKVGEAKFPLLGRAAALTDGRVSDGCLELTFSAIDADPVELKDHFVFRLGKPTLEPMARQGDLVIVRDHANPTPLSLVIALHESRLLARRLQVADNHGDVAVLTASTINPRLTASPVIAKLSTLTMKKVVGVLYESSKPVGEPASDTEIVEAGGESVVKAIMSRAKGLVEVRGDSAEPYALDKQFLIIGDHLSLKDAQGAFDGRPVIAEDSDNARYFKRLRVDANSVILESLEIGGDFAPILLAKGPGPSTHVVKIWPVLGVLFEKP